MYHLFKREEQQKVQLEAEMAERVRAEGEIIRLVRDHELVLNSVAEGIYRLDKHGAITFVKRAAMNIVGWHEAVSIGHFSFQLNLLLFLPFVNQHVPLIQTGGTAEGSVGS